MDLRNQQIKDTYGNLITVGTVAGTPTTGTLQNGAGSNVTALTLAGDLTATNVSATSLTGTLATAAQTNITSVGTLTGLGVSGTTGLDGAVTINDSGANVDFRVEGDTNQNLLFVDASADRVGIGTSSPSEKLTIDSGYVLIKDNAYDEYFLSKTRSDGSQLVGFQSHSLGALSIHSNGAERMRIDSSGRVGIGTSSPTTNLHIEDSSGATLRLATPASGGTSIIQAAGYDSGNLLRFSGAIDFQSVAGSGTANGNIIFSTYPSNSKTERMRIDSSGNVGIGTSSPSRLLDVNGDASIYGVRVGRGAGAISTNTAVGNGALNANTTGTNNTAIGLNALYSNTTGGNNTANGYQALYSNTTANNNTANGVNALYSNTTGSSNTANGFRALYSNTTGANNTANGYQALYSNTTGGQNTANGVNALYSNTTGDNNTANGFRALYSNTTGENNSALGRDAGYDCTTGSGNIMLGGLTNAGTRSPVFSVTTQNNQVVMGTTAVTDAHIQVAWTVVSDERDKMNFGSVPHGLAFVNQLTPISYQFRTERGSDTPNGRLRYGFKAQDILAIEGEDSVIINADDPDKLRYNGESLVPVLVNAIQELSAKVEELQAELLKLKTA